MVESPISLSMLIAACGDNTLVTISIAPPPVPEVSPSPEPVAPITLSAKVLSQTAASNIQIVIISDSLIKNTLIVLPELTVDYQFTFNEGADQVFTSGSNDLFDANKAFSVLKIEGIFTGTAIIVRDLEGNVLATGTAE